MAITQQSRLHRVRCLQESAQTPPWPHPQCSLGNLLNALTWSHLQTYHHILFGLSATASSEPVLLPLISNNTTRQHDYQSCTYCIIAMRRRDCSSNVSHAHDAEENVFPFPVIEQSLPHSTLLSSQRTYDATANPSKERSAVLTSSGGLTRFVVLTLVDGWSWNRTYSRESSSPIATQLCC